MQIPPRLTCGCPGLSVPAQSAAAASPARGESITARLAGGRGGVNIHLCGVTSDPPSIPPAVPRAGGCPRGACRQLSPAHRPGSQPQPCPCNPSCLSHNTDRIEPDCSFPKPFLPLLLRISPQRPGGRGSGAGHTPLAWPSRSCHAAVCHKSNQISRSREQFPSPWESVR